MQPALLTAHRRLDELMIDALVAHPPALPLAPPSEVEIEVVDEVDIAATTRFVRISAPYAAVEVEEVASISAVRVGRSRPRTFARTVPAGTTPAGETAAFDKIWFEQTDDEIAAIPDADITAPRAQLRAWWWLAASLAAAAALVTVLALY